ncbi:hypothetical protein scyTo_0003881, partial [Scyliorhinus torazame]|nr:hypothetical protein [Scyliorhinus torazame]
MMKVGQCLSLDRGQSLYSIEMPGNLFRNATQNIAKELDPYGSLIPATILCDAEKYKLLHLVLVKKGFLWFTKDKYFPTPVTLTDILTDGKDLDFELQSSPVGRYGKDAQISGSAGVAVNVSNVDAGA